jgi:hypothetical protein
VDDVLIETSEEGFIFVQAKRSVDLSSSETSPLASVLDEFVKQYKACEDRQGGHIWARPLALDHDRLVLATPSRSSSKITQILPRLLRGVRDRASTETLSDVQTSAKEREVADVIEAHVNQIWNTVYGTPPTRGDLGRLLRLMWVQVLDVEAEGRDRAHALDLLRGSVLEQADTAETALSTLVQLCGRLRGESSGAEGPSLQRALLNAEIALRAAPDYRRDIQALRAWTELRLSRTPAFTHLIEGRPETVINRAVSRTIRGAADFDSFLVVGEPGAGKSGVCYQLAQHIFDAGRDLVLLPVDLLNVDTMASLSAELRISHFLGEVLRNWPGRQPGILIIDALDAARKSETQTLLRALVDEIMRTAADRWRVVASVRRYDLRQGTEWARIFRGAPPLPDFTKTEFRSVRHVSVRRLSEAELAQIADSIPPLHELFQRAPSKLKELLRNIFNLHLLAELLNDGVVSADLEGIRTQPELLDAYWKHRIHRDDGQRDVREAVLSAVVEKVLASGSLQVARAEIRNHPNAAALSDLERSGVLVASERDGRPDDDTLLFSHNILFDYAVARLVFRRGRDPAQLVERLLRAPELALMVGPSITLIMADRWGAADPNRRGFWNLAFALEGEKDVPEIARLQAPMIVAEDSAANLTDFDPLLDALEPDSSTATAAEGFLRHLVGALFVVSIGGRALVGPAAGPWAALASHLTRFNRNATAYSLSPLVSKLTERIADVTAEQICDLGSAARYLLDFAWSREPRDSRLVGAAIDGVCKTVISDPVTSANLLRRALSAEHMRNYAYEEFRHIANNIEGLVHADPDLAVDIYAAAFGFDETSDAKTGIGNSQLLALTSNRRQDFRGSWYQLAERFPKFLDAHPEEAARGLNRAIEGYVNREHPRRENGDIVIAEFAFGDRTAHFAPDRSSIWLNTSLAGRQDAPQVLNKFRDYIWQLGGALDGTERLRRILSSLVMETRLAVIWRTLLEAGSACPGSFARDLLPLACAAPVLTSPDTRYAAGSFIRAAYPHLHEWDRGAIEAAILALGGQQGQLAQKVLLGCVPVDLFATVLGRAQRDQLLAEGEIRENRPAFEITGGFSPSHLEPVWRSEGVPVEDPDNRDLRKLVEPVERFSKENLNGPPVEATIVQILPAIERLNAAVENADQNDAHQPIIRRALCVLAKASAVLARADLDLLNRTGAWNLILQILLSASRSPYPKFSAEFEEQFDENQNWDGQGARIASAQGTISLLVSAEDPDRQPLMEAVSKLANDEVAHVRYQVARGLSTLWAVDRNWVWEEIERFITEEPDCGVVTGALQSLVAVAGSNLDRTAGLAVALLHRFPADGQCSGVAQCRELCLFLLCDLYLHAEHVPSSAEIERLVQDPEVNEQTIRQLLARNSDWLIAGDPKDAADPGHQSRTRTLAFYGSVLASAKSHLDKTFARCDPDRFGEWDMADQNLVRAMFGILDELTIRLFFASGAHPAQTGVDSEPTPVQLRFFREARSFFEYLAGSPVASIAHRVIETLEYFIDIAPAEVFALIARAVRAAERGGYAMESMAVTTVVRVVERYLADHRHVFVASDRSRDLLDCLDAFVRAGWPAAQTLTFRIADIWR